MRVRAGINRFVKDLQEEGIMMRVLPGQHFQMRGPRVYPMTKAPFRDDVKTDYLMPQLVNSLYPYNMSLEDEFKRLFADFNIPTCWPPKPSAEEVRDDFRRNGKDFEYCPELESGKVHVLTNRPKKPKRPMPTECVFCKNNGEQESYYKEHLLKDISGRTTCPILRAYRCPICGACGDDAHTLKYCPFNKNAQALATFNSMKFLRNSTGVRRASK